MKRILCYGDSNTWGYNANTCGRFTEEVRWPCLLQKELPDCRIIEEGLNGRTHVFEDPVEDVMSGKAYLVPCLKSASPVDLVILMLGTNDIKRRFHADAHIVAEGAAELIRIIREYPLKHQDAPPEVLLICPPPLGNSISTSRFYPEDYDEQSVLISRALSGEYRRVAEEMNCAFLDAASCAQVSPADCVHLTARAHGTLAEAVRKKLAGMGFA